MTNIGKASRALCIAAVTGALLTGRTWAGTESAMPHAMQHSAGMHDMAVPTLPGQDAFGAIQEIVQMLEADPTTDWSTVNLEALRQHLIDMNEVTLHARVAESDLATGARFEITGEGRALPAIQRMVPTHARILNGRNGVSAETELRSDGVTLTLTTADPMQVARIRGLGFIGFMAEGSHHQRHHLAIAKGMPVD